MTSNPKPVCYIIAGPNGSGKTTFAMRYLFELTGCRNFVNADMIAQGLSPLNPTKFQVTAGKMFLQAIRDNIDRREDFAFETTLSGRGHVKLLASLRENGWNIVLYFLWIPSADFSRDRVRERVEHGGHDIPTDAIYRRYARIMQNLFGLYIPLCDELFFYDNSNTVPQLIFEQNRSERIVRNETIYRAVKEQYQ